MDVNTRDSCQQAMPLPDALRYLPSFVRDFGTCDEAATYVSLCDVARTLQEFVHCVASCVAVAGPLFTRQDFKSCVPALGQPIPFVGVMSGPGWSNLSLASQDQGLLIAAWQQPKGSLDHFGSLMPHPRHSICWW